MARQTVNPSQWCKMGELLGKPKRKQHNPQGTAPGAALAWLGSDGRSAQPGRPQEAVTDARGNSARGMRRWREQGHSCDVCWAQSLCWVHSQRASSCQAAVPEERQVVTPSVFLSWGGGSSLCPAPVPIAVGIDALHSAPHTSGVGFWALLV